MEKFLRKNTVDQKIVEEFLRESNAIEGVYDELSYDNAKVAWDYLMGHDVLTSLVIKRTHKLLMRNSDLSIDERGHYRKCPVYIAGREGVKWQLIEPMIIMQFCFETMRMNPLPDWQALHVRYEEIHPFVDGNGRTGRMFMNWTRVKRCGLPIMVIKAEDRGDYYQWFRDSE